jgi:putative NIF3 family GTP cyclohydrolase 1 type 2
MQNNQILTARRVVELIQSNIGVPWREETVDTFKSGNPDAPVQGVAVTMMATLDVLQQSVTCGANMVITHEPTYYGHGDNVEQMARENDALLALKQDFIEKHKLVIWRFHDHWHLRRPDGIQEGMIEKLGWKKYQNSEDDRLFVLPEIALEELATQLKQQLEIDALRVVGERGMKVAKVALSPGSPGFAPHRKLLQRDDVQVLVMGESHEWETIAYGYDASQAQLRKALIILGHVPSEQAGMEHCARWLQTFVSEVPIHFIPTPEPFWTVGNAPLSK